MVLCKFWQQGTCRNGSNCRFEHPSANANPFGANNNRFSAFGNGGTNNASGRSNDASSQYKITKDGLKTDLADERPTWILSCYGPGRDAPKQLFGGYPREQSLEEIMVLMKSSSNQQQTMQEIEGLYTQAQQQIQTTLQDLDGAVQFIIAGENEHPNRNDICKQHTREGGTNGTFARDAVQTGFSANPLTAASTTNQNPFSSNTQANPFGGGGGSTTPAFGQPATLGQKSNPFGSAQPSAFGQPSQMGAASPAFGQPSQMGSAAPAFGQSSQLGAKAPAFGQASQMGGAAPAFGQASTLGQKPNPFGSGATSSSPSPFAQAGGSAFGQPSAIGQRQSSFGTAGASSPSPFGQAAGGNTSSASPFGQAAGTNPLSSNPFGQAAGANTSNVSPFGQAAGSTSSPFGQAASAGSNPFGQAPSASNDQAMDAAPTEPATTNPFGQPSNSGFGTAANNVFGQKPSGFGAATSNPFGQAQQPQAQMQPQAQNQAAGSDKASPYPPGSAKQHPPVEAYVKKEMNGRITAFNNQPVVYKWKVDARYQDQQPPPPPPHPNGNVRGQPTRPDPPVPGVRNPDGTWRKIFCPDGPPRYNKDTEPEPSEYTDAVKAVYVKMAATGIFEGDMPEVPPMREECAWVL
ncbi:hypothetical protein F4778DRAFT_726793 [Xylariomycetidae sp. FL2044]|nr:hypothetical protein F4778DRAFT_726793 [Xylariomycetidae sp. FL2044]